MSKCTYVKAPTSPQAMPAGQPTLPVQAHLLEQLNEELNNVWCRLGGFIDDVTAHAERLIGPCPTATATACPAVPPSSGVAFQLLDGVRNVDTRITLLEEQFARLARL